MKRINNATAVLLALTTFAAFAVSPALGQLASPLSSADGYLDSGTSGYSLSAIGSPSVTSILNTGASVDTGDDGEVDVPIGFGFDFFNTTYTDVQVNGNGVIFLGTGYDPADFYKAGASDNSAHPEDNGGVINLNYAGPRIDLAWDDWNVTDALSTGGIFTETRGSAGSREFVMEMNNVARFAGEPRGVDTVQLILHEGSNDITMHYIDNDGPYDNGLAIGIQANDFTYLQYLYLDGDASVGVGKPSDGQSLLWTPPTAPPTLQAFIDTTTGRVTIENNTGVAQSIKGYEISSLDGEFDPSGAPFLADSDSNWIQLSANDGGDLSEGHLTTGSIAAGTTIDFGEGSWAPYYKQEAEFKVVTASGETLRLPLTYTGGVTYEFLDLNFDGTINIQDWVTFRNNVGNDLSVLSTTAQLYRNADLNTDGRHDTADFVIFADAYDAAVGAGAFARIQNVPEPTTFAMLGLMGVGSVLIGRRSRRDSQQDQHKEGHRLTTTNHSASGPQRWPAIVTAFAAVAVCVLLPTLASAQLPLFFEDFESLPYGPNQEEGLEGTNVWTDVPPDGWSIDRTGVPGFDEPPENNGVKEWIGWNFANKDWWIGAAGGQRREEFLLGRGGVMVADPDEWDDADHPDSAANGWYATDAVTAPISVANLPANVVQLNFDSSWRDEFDSNFQQTVAIDVAFDGGAATRVLLWESDPASPNFKDDAPNEEISIDIANPLGSQEMVVTFKMFDAGNDWWWAIDNLEVVAVGDPLNLQVNKTTGEMSLTTGNLPSVFNSYNIESPSGALNAAGWNAGNLSSEAGGGGSPADADGSGTVDGPDALLLQRAGTSLDQWQDDFGSEGGGAPGDQWEVLNSADDQLFEAYLFGSEFLDASSSKSIGTGYDTASGNEDLTFFYTTPSGNNLQGTVTYVGGSVAAVPEPTSLATAGLAIAAGLAVGRRRRNQLLDLGVRNMQAPHKRLLAVASVVVSLAVWTATAAAQTNDRLYELGDSEPTNGAGSVVGSGAGSFGVTWDDAGLPNMGQFHDLSPFGSPTYVTVSGRPDGGTGLGVQFNGTSQFLRSNRVGDPATTITSTTQSGGTLDYFDLRTRGMAFWVQPGGGDGPQSIVMDTNQHGVRINESGNFSMRFNNLDFDSNVAATPGEWFHVEVVHTGGAGTFMYINGNGAAQTTGGYNAADDAPLVIGSNTMGTLSTFTGGTTEFFNGIVDELSIYVFGTSDGGTNFGEYDFVDDNAFVIDVLGASPNLADVNQDGSVSGDGTGPAGSDDVTAFVAGWQSRNIVNGSPMGGLDTISNGDINVDGIVNISDWALLNAANPQVGAAVLAALGAVPEPSSCLLALAGFAACGFRRRR